MTFDLSRVGRRRTSPIAESDQYRPRLSKFDCTPRSLTCRGAIWQRQHHVAPSAQTADRAA
jgi:hypothetical protein